MTPAPESQVRVELGGSQPPLNMVMCDGLTTNGEI
jgi:hypothetical protein